MQGEGSERRALLRTLLLTEAEIQRLMLPAQFDLFSVLMIRGKVCP